jgi:hypothetical protein
MPKRGSGGRGVPERRQPARGGLLVECVLLSAACGDERSRDRKLLLIKAT